MKPIKNWESVQAAGDYKSLPIGAYICKIIEVKIEKNKNSDGEHLKFAIDICEGEYADFFDREYKNNTNEDRWWKGTYIQNIPNEASAKYGQQCRFFKRFINQIEESNPGYHWDWNEKDLKNKKIGIVFKSEEKESKAGNIYTATSADSTISVQDVRDGNFKIPELKKLSKPQGFTDLGSGAFPPPPNVSAEDDDSIPFF